MNTFSPDFNRGYADGETNQRSVADQPSAEEMSGHSPEYRLGFVTGWVSAFAAGDPFAKGSVAGDMGRDYDVPAYKLIKELGLTSPEHIKMVMDDYEYDGE
ncbi:hypothetical protein PQR02_37630 [Paraburkholderia sediminicola]|uniref:Uncharacterized protein n=1 Tax=Paraburkholderia rhynchosiae TaxID=487049 RepID=A0ACC7NN82_9BURK